MKTYYMLTKPGIIFGNIVTMAAGFFLASRGDVNYPLFFITLLALTLVVASAGVFNNYFDRVADSKMERTKERPLAKGTFPVKKALFFAFILGSLGFSIFGLFTNPLTFFMSAFGFFAYLVLYAFFKYRSFYGTIIGSISGALPPVIGYTAAANTFDLAGFLLFLVVVLWQMPHFFAIALYRMEDYKKASIPVLPLVKGVERAKKEMALYVVAFTFASVLLYTGGYTGQIYLYTVVALGLIWFLIALQGFKEKNTVLWAKRMFFFSLIVIMLFSFVVSFDVI